MYDLDRVAVLLAATLIICWAVVLAAVAYATW